MPDKIILDMTSFKALSSLMRISILKALDKNRMTLTELSENLDLSKPALLKHMEDLINAGLISKEEKKRKWIYYELTFKGRRILHPETVAVTLLLSTALVTLIISIISFINFAFNKGNTNLHPSSTGGGNSASNSPGAMYDYAFLPASATNPAWLFIGIAFLVIFLITILGIFWYKRKYRNHAKKLT